MNRFLLAALPLLVTGCLLAAPDPLTKEQYQAEQRAEEEELFEECLDFCHPYGCDESVECLEVCEDDSDCQDAYRCCRSTSTSGCVEGECTPRVP